MAPDDICGYTGTTTGEPCGHPAGSCPVPSHHDEDAENPHGRPSGLDDDARDALYAAVGSGLKVDHVAAAAGISRRTLSRWTCCLKDLRTCAFDTDDPCDFCQGYARAHAQGARSVLEECRPEFRASASFGYAKRERLEADVTADVDQRTTHDLDDDTKDILLDVIRRRQETESA